MAISTQTQIKANAIASALTAIAGSTPSITYKDTYAEINFNSEQQKNIRKYIDKQLVGSNKPSDVNINFYPIITPIVLKTIWPYVLGLIVFGYVAGKIKI